MNWVGGFFILHPTFFLLQIISQMQISFLMYLIAVLDSDFGFNFWR